VKLDLHIHTNASYDSQTTPQEAVNTALRRMLSGIAVTDHDSMANIQIIRQLAPPELLVIPGAEYSTDCGHVLALFCDEFYSPTPIKLAQLAPFVRQRGGILIAAHPRNTLTQCQANAQYLDGFEAANAHYPRGNTIIKKIAARQGKIVTAGSDAHIPNAIGRNTIKLPDDTPLTLEAVKAALLARKQTIPRNPCNFVRWAARKLRKKLRKQP